MQKFDNRNSISGIIPDDKNDKIKLEEVRVIKEKGKPGLQEGKHFEVIPGGKLNPQSGEKKG